MLVDNLSYMPKNNSHPHAHGICLMHEPQALPSMLKGAPCACARGLYNSTATLYKSVSWKIKSPGKDDSIFGTKFRNGGYKAEYILHSRYDFLVDSEIYIGPLF